MLVVACQNNDKPGSGSGSGSIKKNPNIQSKIEQVTPPLDLKTPPVDAVKTATGLVYKKLVENAAGAMPHRNDTVVINLTGWTQSTGETFNTTMHRQPQMLPLANASPGFVEGLQLLHKGESAMLWIPPALGYVRPPTSGTPDTLVYQVELIEIAAAPPIPEDVAAPPASALALPSGMKYVVEKPGTGKDRARFFDSVTFNFTGWDAEGRMIQTTETSKHAQNTAPYKQSPAFAEILVTMVEGERVRLWTTSERLGTNGKAIVAGAGPLCYELELATIGKGVEPPPVPADVAAPPPTAKRTPKGVAYVVLKAGTSKQHAAPDDRVRVHYTGWRAADGRMFESSVVRNEPVEIGVGSPPVAGWTEPLELMTPGDKYRVWVPEELAYKATPGRPQGMLVFEIELLEIKAPPTTKPAKHP